MPLYVVSWLREERLSVIRAESEEHLLELIDEYDSPSNARGDGTLALCGSTSSCRSAGNSHRQRYPAKPALPSRFLSLPSARAAEANLEILYKARRAIGGSVTSGLRLGTDADGMVRTAHRAEVFGKLGSAERSPFRFRRDEVVKWTPDEQDRSALGHLMKARFGVQPKGGD